MNKITEQELNQFLDSMNEQFGFYLDCIMGFKCNLSSMILRQKEGGRLTGVSIEELDQRAFIRADVDPPRSLEECEKLIKHRTTQGEHKEDNSFGGRNYRFALLNCICSIFNEWATFKIEVLEIYKKNDQAKDKKKEEREDEKRVPVFKYLRKIRNRISHADKKYSKDIERFELTHAPGRCLPGFKKLENIELSESHLDDILAEVRASILNILPDENS